LAIVITVIIVGIVSVAWRIRASIDKSEAGLKERPVISKKAEKSQEQIAIERLENRQAELSKRVDQILEAKAKVTKPKAVKKTIQKTSSTKTVSKPKKKKV
jgi:hypothetical protein